ncbi:MAG TPA: VOC family protein [Candidatus Thermoplasmatota archaeon]|jgi:PhnB protein|nr:VOC family protein [Candidatus Thermoplasmatota archaeon]
MPTRPALAPLLTVENVDKTYEYFTQVLGWQGTGRMPGPNGQTVHAEAILGTKYGAAFVMLAPLNSEQRSNDEFDRNLRAGPLGNGVITYVTVPDVDKYHSFIASRGADVTQAPKDEFWGDRTMVVRTPDGYFVTFAAPIKGFKWPADQLAAITGAVKPTAPGAKRVALPGAPAPKKAKAAKASKAKAKKKR